MGGEINLDQTTAEKLLSTNLPSIQVTRTSHEAYDMMGDLGVRHLVICEGDTIVGMVSMRISLKILKVLSQKSRWIKKWRSTFFFLLKQDCASFPDWAHGKIIFLEMVQRADSGQKNPAKWILLYPPSSFIHGFSDTSNTCLSTDRLRFSFRNCFASPNTTIVICAFQNT
jgi:hypothetical protein